MQRPISVDLPTETRQALAEMALREDRDLESQAVRFIREGLIGAGLLPRPEPPAFRPSPGTLAPA